MAAYSATDKSQVGHVTSVKHNFSMNDKNGTVVPYLISIRTTSRSSQLITFRSLFDIRRNEHFPLNTGSCLSKGPDKTTYLASLKPADKTIPLWFLGIMQHLQATDVVKAKVFRYSQNLLN